MIKNKPNHLYRLGDLLLIVLYWVIVTRIIVFMEYFSLNQSDTYFGEPKVYSVLLFFAFQDYLAGRADYYEDKYAVVPVFKGAVNSGKVMVAEVGGNIKSEIAYHGDVLNTAARMIELCKLYDRKLIVSESIVNQLNKGICSVEFELHGDFRLRGKDGKMKIYSASCEK